MCDSSRPKRPKSTSGIELEKKLLVAERKANAGDVSSEASTETENGLDSLSPSPKAGGSKKKKKKKAKGLNASMDMQMGELESQLDEKAQEISKQRLEIADLKAELSKNAGAKSDNGTVATTVATAGDLKTTTETAEALKQKVDVLNHDLAQKDRLILGLRNLREELLANSNDEHGKLANDDEDDKEQSPTSTFVDDNISEFCSFAANQANGNNKKSMSTRPSANGGKSPRRKSLSRQIDFFHSQSKVLEKYVVELEAAYCDMDKQGFTLVADQGK